MKIMVVYLISRMRADIRKTLPLFCSILLASVVISIFSLMYLAQYSRYIDFAVSYSGSQHFTINEPLTNEQYAVLQDSPDITEVRCEGDYTYVTLRNVKNVYPISEALAQSLGMERNGYGVYNITYNRQLLGLYGIKDPYAGGLTALEQLLLTASVFIVIVMVLFAVMICGAYKAFARSRLSELGLLKSIGATPSQLRFHLYLEMLLYSVPAIIIGAAVGYVVQSIAIKPVFSLWVMLLCAVCVLLTVFFSTSSQIHRLTWLPIVSSISGNTAKTGNFNRRRRTKESRPIDCNYPARALAWQFYRGSRGTYRMSVIALSLFYAINMSFMVFITFTEANSIIAIDKQQYNIKISSGEPLPQDDILNEIAEIGDAYTAYYMDVCTVYADGDVDTNVASSVWQHNGRYVLHTIIYGFDDIAYRNFLSYAGIDGADDGIILVNNARGTSDTYKNYPSLANGLPIDDLTSITLCARTAYDLTNDVTVTVPIAATTEVYPQDDNIYFPYNTVLVMPADEYERIDTVMRGSEAMLLSNISLHVPYGEIAQCSSRISSILDQTGFQYSISTRLDEEQRISENLSSTYQFFYLIIIFFGILGLLNAINSINTSIEARRHELAMLDDIGMDTNEKRTMLLWEAVAYTVFPLAFSMPVVLTATMVFKLIFKAVPLLMLFQQLPYLRILLSVIPAVAVIFAVYLYHSVKYVKAAHTYSIT